MSKANGRRVDQTHIPKLISMSPAPCRMLLVEVLGNNEMTEFSVNWSDVVGVLCVVETEYLKLCGSVSRLPAAARCHAR